MNGREEDQGCGGAGLKAVNFLQPLSMDKEG
jgi:hypothetical protein